MLAFSHYKPQNHLRKLAISSNVASLHMASRFLLKPTAPPFPVLPSTPPPFPSSSSSNACPYHTCKRLLQVFCSKPIPKIHPSFLKTNGLSYSPVPAPGDRLMERRQDGDSSIRRCLPTCCGWADQASADSNKISEVQCLGQMTEESLGLAPLGDMLIAYFGERMISKGTLRRNAVMQKSGDQAAIAFTYRQNGVLVGCKYRTIEKKFGLEKGSKKCFYGVDDIAEATEIIIVEGEIDKLSMEEAGFHNCVSVPQGAPPKVSAKKLPALEKDTAYQYLWDCKEHLDKVSRIILATDGDAPGQALAEELARRLGKERCWLVHWPKKDEFNSFKDANEVLKCLGPDGLKAAIENAELYPTKIVNEKCVAGGENGTSTVTLGVSIGRSTQDSQAETKAASKTTDGYVNAAGTTSRQANAECLRNGGSE